MRTWRTSGMLAASKRLPTAVAAVVLVNLAVQPLTAQGATYDYVAPQVAPPVAANLGTAGITAILNETAPNRAYLVAYQLTTTDVNNKIAGGAPLKVVPTDHALHPYRAVFHNQNNST